MKLKLSLAKNSGKCWQLTFRMFSFFMNMRVSLSTNWCSGQTCRFSVQHAIHMVRTNTRLPVSVSVLQICLRHSLMLRCTWSYDVIRLVLIAPVNCRQNSTQSCKKIVFVRYPGFQPKNVWISYLVKFVTIWNSKYT